MKGKRVYRGADHRGAEGSRGWGEEQGTLSVEYNTELLHGSLRNHTPQEFATDRTNRDEERALLTANSNAMPDHIGCPVELIDHGSANRIKALNPWPGP